MFFEQLKISLRTLVVLSVLTGIIYPLAVTGIAQVVFPGRANGSLIMKDGNAVGSNLIGQNFDDPKYFWGRLSATTPPYNASSSSGSNLGPLNPDLIKEVSGRVDALKAADKGNKDLIPVDLATSSGSGLDPHISPAAADYQVARVVKVRGISKDDVEKLIAEHTTGRWLGVLGEPVVNVLELNLALDELSAVKH
jgi:K+-transporting ATPase ATPase C chain